MNLILTLYSLRKPFFHMKYSEAPCRSMLLSTFSHYSFFHIFANMYVLNSFSNGVCMALGKEQAVALYLTAGCVASFASYMHKVVAGISGASLGAVSFMCLIHSKHVLKFAQ